jgi:hypothetical protein
MTLTMDIGARSTGRLASAIDRGPGRITTWLCLIGVFFPGGLVTFDAFGAKLTVGRSAVLLLLLPALVRLGKSYRRMIPTDYLICVMASWMVGDAMYVGNADSISSAIAVAIEYAGGYFVGRGLIAGPEATAPFIRALKWTIAVIVVLALADSISGRLIVHDTIAGLAAHVPMLAPDFRLNMVRATATFDHPILLGTFCAIAGTILMGSERTLLKWAGWVGLCLVGCFLSMSSAPFLSFLIALAAFAYGRIMEPYPWRWSALWIALATVILFVMAVTNHPLGWIISHMTLDPESGYFRMLIWDIALPKIADQPITGFAFNLFGDYILDYTVDSVWLLQALRFGIPMVLLLALTNVSAFLPVRDGLSRSDRRSSASRLTSGFTAALVLLMLTGLTVHYWHYMWIFWGLCLGIRASLRESSLAASRRRRIESSAARITRFNYRPLPSEGA